MPAQLPNENSPVGHITDPDSERTLGASEFAPDASGHTPGIYDGGLQYPEGAIRSALAFAEGPMVAYYVDPAPWKVAEEWQIAEISYAVEYANQDPRRMNEAQAKATQTRTKGPKIGPRASTGEIIGNLSSSAPNAITGDDNAVMALLGL